jgi:hypothetical protein
MISPAIFARIIIYDFAVIKKKQFRMRRRTPESVELWSSLRERGEELYRSTPFVCGDVRRSSVSVSPLRRVRAAGAVLFGEICVLKLFCRQGTKKNKNKTSGQATFYTHCLVNKTCKAIAIIGAKSF